MTTATITGYTRQECIKFTGCSSSRLSYLERVGLIIPQRFGGNARPVVLFTLGQLVAVKVIKNLREEIPLAVVRAITEKLIDHDFGTGELKRLAVINESAVWVKDDLSDLGSHIKSFVKPNGVTAMTVFVVPNLDEVAIDIMRLREKVTA